jgi:hypothetical protein
MSDNPRARGPPTPGHHAFSDVARWEKVFDNPARAASSSATMLSIGAAPSMVVAASAPAGYLEARSPRRSGRAASSTRLVDPLSPTCASGQSARGRPTSSRSSARPTRRGSPPGGSTGSCSSTPTIISTAAWRTFAGSARRWLPAAASSSSIGKARGHDRARAVAPAGREQVTDEMRRAGYRPLDTWAVRRAPVRARLRAGVRVTDR